MVEPEVKLLPEPKSGLEGLFASPDSEDDEEIIRASLRPDASVRVRAMLKSAGVLEGLPQPARDAVSKLASRMQAFRKTQVLLLAPDLHLQ